jgi:hypothetical protein
MGNIRGDTKEITFREVKFAFDLTSTYRVIVRDDDQRVEVFSSMPIADAMERIDRYVDNYMVSDVSINRITRVTTEHGYLLIIVFELDCLTSLISFELDLDRD